MRGAGGINRLSDAPLIRPNGGFPVGAGCRDRFGRRPRRRTGRPSGSCGRYGCRSGGGQRSGGSAGPVGGAVRECGFPHPRKSRGRPGTLLVAAPAGKGAPGKARARCRLLGILLCAVYSTGAALRRRSPRIPRACRAFRPRGHVTATPDQTPARPREAGDRVLRGGAGHPAVPSPTAGVQRAAIPAGTTPTLKSCRAGSTEATWRSSWYGSGGGGGGIGRPSHHQMSQNHRSRPHQPR